MRVTKGKEELKKLFDLSGKVAVVTGGSGGAGKAISIGLALYGADVVVTAFARGVVAEPDRSAWAPLHLPAGDGGYGGPRGATCQPGRGVAVCFLTLIPRAR